MKSLYTSIQLSDYSLVGKDTELAIAKGLAEATWYQSPVSRQTLRELLVRKDGPALRDTAIWFGLIIDCAVLGARLWGSWWAIIPFAIYGALYASTSDARWHESSHGTAFRTDWLNNALYEVASFMVMRESVPWRWSHTRHHSDTIIVGRDPEIAVPRPPNLSRMLAKIFGVVQVRTFFRNVVLHSLGRLNSEEKTYVPESEYPAIFVRARIYLLIYATVGGIAVATHSLLPLMYVGLPTVYGSWLIQFYGVTQHAGLAENVLDHRLNCRTLYMDPMNRFLYWNMNYHVEHHMFPLVPYHNLPRLHELIKDDCPPAYDGLLDAWREIVPTVLRQVRDPGYFVRRRLPTPTVRADAPPTVQIFQAKGKPVDGWVEVGASSFLQKEDVIRFDHDQKTYAIYRTEEGELHATDGTCTHGNTHLAEGLVKGKLIECPKHNGRFDIRDGSPQRPPACIALRAYRAKEYDGKIFLDLHSANNGNGNRPAFKFRVVSNENVATFIKELVLEADEGSTLPTYLPGQYLQFEIPAYGEIAFDKIVVREPYASVWKAQHVFNFRSEGPMPIRRNYSIAANPTVDKVLRFNVRIATPPQGQDCPAGAGSAYMHRLKPGDRVTAAGPFGNFHIKSGNAEIVYVGAGSGMAPLRSHISHLFETQATKRKVSFWYGARSRQELFYADYFEGLARAFPNFIFHPALSQPLPTDRWSGHVGHVHDVLFEDYLKSNPNAGEIEYYLCGPPAMVQAASKMLAQAGVSAEQVACDEF